MSEVIGADSTAAFLLKLAVTAGPKAEAAVRTYGSLLKTQVQANASGRPGPRVITGNYRRSITVEMGGSLGTPTAIVGTTAPQARRLEFGFAGRDSRGRNYANPPLAHWRPAISKVEPMFVDALAQIVDD